LHDFVEYALHKADKDKKNLKSCKLVAISPAAFILL